MKKWQETNEIWLYDGSFEGLLTIIYRSKFLKEIPFAITNNENYNCSLLEKIVEITTNKKQTEEIAKEIQMISDFSFYNVCNAYLSCDQQKEMVTLKYALKLFAQGARINQMNNLEIVLNMMKITKRVTLEAHRLKGFLRFKELSNGILYAQMTPDNNIIEHLVLHFQKRLKNEHWVIHDLQRKTMAIYDTKKCYLESDEILDSKKLESLSQHDAYELLWQNYYHNIAIPERTNHRCQIQFMPKRYWQNMLETKNEN